VLPPFVEISTIAPSLQTPVPPDLRFCAFQNLSVVVVRSAGSAMLGETSHASFGAPDGGAALCHACVPLFAAVPSVQVSALPFAAPCVQPFAPLSRSSAKISDGV